MALSSSCSMKQVRRRLAHPTVKGRSYKNWYWQIFNYNTLKSGIDIAPAINITPVTFGKTNNCNSLNKRSPTWIAPQIIVHGLAICITWQELGINGFIIVVQHEASKTRLAHLTLKGRSYESWYLQIFQYDLFCGCSTIVRYSPQIQKWLTLFQLQIAFKY